MVNERRLALDDRENDLATKAVEGLHAGALDELRAGQSVEFYRNFNAGGVSAIKGLDDPDANYVFISFDGVVPVHPDTGEKQLRVLFREVVHGRYADHEAALVGTPADRKLTVTVPDTLMSDAGIVWVQVGPIPTQGQPYRVDLDG